MAEFLFSGTDLWAGMIGLAVPAICLWFRVAVQPGEDEEVRRMLCQEAYGWFERAMR